MRFFFSSCLHFLKGKRWVTAPGSESSEPFVELLKGLLSSVSASLSKPVCKTNAELNVKSELVRTREVSILIPVAGPLIHQPFAVRVRELVRRRAQTRIPRRPLYENGWNL